MKITLKKKNKSKYEYFDWRNTRTRCQVCSKLTVGTPKNVFVVNFEHISHLVLVFLLLAFS